MTHKAREIFNMCDQEEKGFITKRDMQRLQRDLPLTPDQLEVVFDSLDSAGNGYLTLKEFADGFGELILLSELELWIGLQELQEMRVGLYQSLNIG